MSLASESQADEPHRRRAISKSRWALAFRSPILGLRCALFAMITRCAMLRLLQYQGGIDPDRMRLAAMHRTLLCLTAYRILSSRPAIESPKEPVIGPTCSVILISDCVNVNHFHKMSCPPGGKAQVLRRSLLIALFPTRVPIDRSVGG